MKEKIIHPKRLAYFAEVFKLGSINAAADRLNMVQAGIVRQIQLLEQELGVLLFERRKRGGRGMVPTEAAQILYDHYGRYCDWQDKMAAAVPREPTEKGKVINVKRLFHFSQVFQHGSINAAADRLNRVQAGIGRQIRLLEQELGVRLFERGTNGRGMVPGGQGRGMVPTEAAETLYGFYHQYCDWQDKLEAAIEEWCSMKRGEICIAVLSAYVKPLMREIVHAFYQEYPAVNIRIKEFDDVSQIVTQVLEGQVHIGIVHHHYSPSVDICCYKRVPLSVCMLVNPQHPLANKRKGDLSSIAPYPFVTPSRCVKRLREVQLAPTLVIDSFIARKELAIYGPGVLMSVFAACQEISTGQLVPFEIDHPIFTSMEACLISRRGSVLSPAANQLIRLIASKFSIFRSPPAFNIGKPPLYFTQRLSSTPVR